MQKGNSRNRFRNQCLAVKHNGAVVKASFTDAKKFPYLYPHPGDLLSLKSVLVNHGKF